MSSNSAELSTGAFAYSHHVQFAGQVNFTENTISHNTSLYGGDGLAELYKRCAREAIFDSQLRDLPPAPHIGLLPETNLRIIRRWGNRIDGPSILWLHGPAQTGKTAMAQRLAEEWVEQDRLIATYMFSTAQSRTSWRLSKDEQRQQPPIILTLAFQLARARLDIADHIRNIYNRDPSIYDSVMQKQFKELIVQPLLASEPGIHPVIIIVDALEQCGHTLTQRNFVNLFTSSVTSELSARMKLFVCSRADPKAHATDLLILETSPNLEKNIQTRVVNNANYYGLIDIFRLNNRFFGGVREYKLCWDEPIKKSFIDHGGLINKRATFESSSRPMDTCLEHTVQTVLSRIRDWGDKSSTRPVLWLSGSVGSGKSCVARTLTKQWENSRALATFDFSVKDPRNFIITCAYQIFRSQSPIYDLEIEKRICLLIDGVKHSSMSEQFRTLIIPFIKPESRPAIILIDALDECKYPKLRADVLDFIASYTLTSTSHPVKFLISSRPRRQVRQTMEDIFIADRLDKVSLEPARETDSDIAKYFEHEFSHIQTIVPSFKYDDTVVLELVRRSAGNFLFASIVAKYVGDVEYDPGTRLDSVINITDTIESGPLENLDALYLNILENSGLEPELLTRLLRHPLMDCTPSNIKEFIGFKDILKFAELEPEKYDLSYTDNYLEKLRPLKPLLIMSENSENVLIRHPTFGAFLKNKSRSKQFYVQV